MTWGLTLNALFIISHVSSGNSNYLTLVHYSQGLTFQLTWALWPQYNLLCISVFFNTVPPGLSNRICTCGRQVMRSISNGDVEGIHCALLTASWHSDEVIHMFWVLLGCWIIPWDASWRTWLTQSRFIQKSILRSIISLAYPSIECSLEPLMTKEALKTAPTQGGV